MSSVVVNKVNSDVVEIEIIESRSDKSTTALQEALLDGQKEYNFAVVQLSCDLQQHPMFPITEEFELFRIVRRNVDESLTDQTAAYDLANANFVTWSEIDSLPELSGGYSDAQMTTFANVTLGLALGAFDRAAYILAITTHLEAVLLAAQLPTTVNLLGRNGSYYISPNKPFYSPIEFIQDLNSWGNVFNIEQTILGIDPNYYGSNPNENLAAKTADEAELLRDNDEEPTKFLKFSCTADGSLEIECTPLLLNNFVILMSNYGAALMGLDTTQFQTVGGYNYIAYTEDAVAPFTDPDNNDIILDGGNQASHAIATVVPIFQSSDQRVKVSVESDLSMNSNVKIDNQVELRDRDIVSSFFTNKIESQIEFDNDMDIDGLSIKTQIYNGRYSFVKKTDYQHQWNQLLSSFDLRLLRFYLRITYRDFDEATNTFTLSKKELTIPDNSYWHLVVRFVSNI